MNDESVPVSPLPPPLDRPLAQCLEGPRLLLRPDTASDVDSLASLIGENLAHLEPFMPWVQSEPLSIDERISLIDGWNEEAAHGGGIVLGCYLAGELIGSTGLHRRRPDASSLEIGYWLSSSHTGRGFATELTLMLIDEAFEHPEIAFVDLYCEINNDASAAVARRAGFALLGVESSRSDDASSLSKAMNHFRLGRESHDAGWRARF